MTDYKEERYTCTRPKLASILINEGCFCTIQVNPWDAHKKVWVFPISDKLAKIVTDYYADIGKDVPKVIKDYQDRKGGTDI